ncbi:Fc.00g093170.m01.CDS01 [Cosmosporella sp. VM-42]
MPLNAACASGTCVTLYGLIFLGSSAAFSSMVGAYMVFMTSSVVIVGHCSFILIAWFTNQRHVFKGPSINFDLLNESRNERVHGIPMNDGVDVREVMPMSSLVEYPEEAAGSAKTVKGE